jgi:UDP-glucose 4-epimerase
MRSFVKKNILVTGGAGFIGSHLVDKLIEEGANKVIAFDSMFLGSEDNLYAALKQGAELIKDDIEFKSSLEYVLQNEKIDVVFNCATKALNYSFVNPSNAFNTNVNGILNLLEFQRQGLFQSLCHFSTSEVYGTAIYEPMDEEHPKNPTTLYAAGKASADLALESYVRMFDVDAFIVRPFNNYGPRQNYKGYMAGIIPITAYRILSNQKPEMHGNGTQSRDFIYVHDTIDAIIKAFPILNKGEAVNISTDNSIDIQSLLHKITKFYNYQGPIDSKAERGADVLCHNASNKKINELITYHLTDFDDGLENTLRWYQDLFASK